MVLVLEVEDVLLALRGARVRGPRLPGHEHVGYLEPVLRQLASQDRARLHVAVGVGLHE